MRTLLVVIILAILPAASWAVKVANLYQAEVPVSSQASDERAKAVQVGLLELLVKLTSDSKIDLNPVIHENLSRADYYIQDFNYALPSTSSSHYLLQIRYNKDDIDRLLRRAGVTFWSDERPLLLTWLVITDDQQNDDIVHDEKLGQIGTALKQQSKALELPLIFPNMDIDDINQVTPDTIKDMAMPALRAASKRYAPEAYLIGKLQLRENGYVSNWLLVWNDKKWGWAISGKSLDDMSSALLKQVSQTLAKNYVTKTVVAPQVWLKLEVSNLNATYDRDQLVTMLKQIPQVKQLKLAQMPNNITEIAVELTGSLQAFQQHISTNAHLFLKSPDVSDNTLFYEWIP